MCDCRTLVNAANKWLNKNNDVEVRSCESVLWTGNNPELLEEVCSGESMVITKTLSDDAKIYNLVGLR